MNEIEKNPIDALRESMPLEEWRCLVAKMVQAPNYCLAVLANGTICYNEARHKWTSDFALGIPLCDRHFDVAMDRTIRWYWETYDHVSSEVVAEQEAIRERARLDDAELAHRIAIGALKGSCVYYVRRSDGLVKIGFSTRLAARVKGLATEFGPLELLATEPGGLKQEQLRHRQFKRNRVEGEWFRPNGPLLKHISALNVKAA